MDIGSIFLLLALVILIVFFVAQPFLNRSKVSSQSAGNTRQQLSLLRVERARVIQALQELDFDYLLGKIPQEDYPAQRNTLLLRGAEVLQKLDTLQPQPTAWKAGDQLEEALAARRKALSETSSEAATREQNDDLEELIAARRRARNGSAPREKSIGFCPQCGKSIQKSDRFCPKCGTELAKH
jgi:ribosomal protein S27AE